MGGTTRRERRGLRHGVVSLQEEADKGSLNPTWRVSFHEIVPRSNRENASSKRHTNVGFKGFSFRFSTRTPFQSHNRSSNCTAAVYVWTKNIQGQMKGKQKTTGSSLSFSSLQYLWTRSCMKPLSCAQMCMKTQLHTNTQREGRTQTS